MHRISTMSPASTRSPFRAWRRLFLLFAGVLVLGVLSPLPASAAPAALMVRDAAVVEGNSASAAVVRVVLTNRVDHRVAVHYVTRDGGAKAGLDYMSESGRIVFPAGTRVQRVTIPIIDDALDERDEGFYVRLFSPVRAGIGDRVGKVTILDDDPTPSVSVGDVSATEPDSGTTTMRFPVSLSAPSGRGTAVSYVVTAGTATSGSDYLVAAAAGRLHFPAGTTSQWVDVAVLGDTAQEPGETLNVTLLSPTYLTIGDGSAVGTILESDLPTLSVADLTVWEGDKASFTVSLSKKTVLPVTFDYATSNGSAAAPGDYKVTTGSATIPANSASVTVDVQTTEDVVNEPAEHFLLTLSNVKNASVTDGQAKATINDDDSASVVSVADASATEGKDMVFTVSLSKLSGFDVKVDWATGDGVAKAPGDYLPTHGTLVIPAGQTSGHVSVGTVADGTDEVNETFHVFLSKPEHATIGDGDGVGTILDDDGPNISVDDKSVNEAAGAVQFRVTLSKTSVQDVKVDWRTSDGTAKANSDYTFSQGTATVLAGNLFVDFSVPVTNDLLDEDNETFVVDLSNPQYGTIVDGHGVATIEDNDASPSLSIGDLSVAEGGTASFTVTLSAVSGRNVTVDWATGGGSADSPQDYHADHGTVSIAAGATTVKIEVATENDHFDEMDETFGVTLSNAHNATISDASAVATILDND